MVNRSPSSNFAFRHIRNMAPTPAGSKNTKGKNFRSKVPAGSADPVVKAKRKVNCSKCKSPHFPPTGRACQKVVTTSVTIPNHDLSSTLNTEDMPPPVSPALSPVKPDSETQAALDILFRAQAQALAHASPTTSTLSPVRADPNTSAAQVTDKLIDIIAAQQAQFTAQAQTLAHVSPSVPPVAQPPFNLIHRPGPGTQSAPINNAPGPSTQSAPIPRDTEDNNYIKGILMQLLESQKLMTVRHDNLVEQVRRNALSASKEPVTNNNVFSNQQDQWEEMSNTSVGFGTPTPAGGG